MNPLTSPTSRNLTEPEAASRIGVCRLTLLRIRQRGDISFYRVGTRVLYAPEHIEAFLRRNERVAREEANR